MHMVQNITQVRTSICQILEALYGITHRTWECNWRRVEDAHGVISWEPDQEPSKDPCQMLKFYSFSLDLMMRISEAYPRILTLQNEVFKNLEMYFEITGNDTFSPQLQHNGRPSKISKFVRRLVDGTPVWRPAASGTEQLPPTLAQFAVFSTEAWPTGGHHALPLLEILEGMQEKLSAMMEKPAEAIPPLHAKVDTIKAMLGLVELA